MRNCKVCGTQFKEKEITHRGMCGKCWDALTKELYQGYVNLFSSFTFEELNDLYIEQHLSFKMYSAYRYCMDNHIFKKRWEN